MRTHTYRRTMSPSLDDAVRRFQPKRKQVHLLQEHQEAILSLRARGATCAEIESLLKQHGLHVSEASIMRFCRKHAGKPTPMTPPAETTLPPPSSPIDKPPAKVRDLRGPV